MTESEEAALVDSMTITVEFTFSAIPDVSREKVACDLAKQARQKARDPSTVDVTFGFVKNHRKTHPALTLACAPDANARIARCLHTLLKKNGFQDNKGKCSRIHFHCYHQETGEKIV